MDFNTESRFNRINAAIANLFEESRAARRERERKGGKGEMVTGLDGKQYPLGADPTRAQPGSALAVQKQKEQQAKVAAGRPETTPGLRGQPMTAPAPTARKPTMPKAGTVAYGTQDQRIENQRGYVAYGSQNQRPTTSTPAMTDADRKAQGFDTFDDIKAPTKAPAAPSSQGMIQLPPSAATALADGDSAMKAYVNALDQGNPWRGAAEKPKATPVPPANQSPSAAKSDPRFSQQPMDDQGNTVFNNNSNNKLAGSLMMTGSTSPTITNPPSMNNNQPQKTPNFVEITPEERQTVDAENARVANEKAQEKRRMAYGGRPNAAEQKRRDDAEALMTRATELEKQRPELSADERKYLEGRKAAEQSAAATKAAKQNQPNNYRAQFPQKFDENFALPATKMILENSPKSPISSDRGKFSLEQTIRSLGR